MTSFSNGSGYNLATCNRIVEVFVSDPDSFNIPPDQALLFHLDRFTTNKTDQEIMLDLQLPAITSDWNAKRVLMRDKRFPESTVMLEPLKPRDLRISIATVVTL